MSNDEHAFATSNATCDGTLEERSQARCRHCQALTAGRHRVVRFPPGADLLDAKPGTSLRLVQAGKRAVHTNPAPHHHRLHRLERRAAWLRQLLVARGVFRYLGEG
ncbi:hypothetical protein FHU13_003026 [Methylobacterium sp. R2-1]|nr:hypothetical protein [Methylobacterium sp. R2-1]